jgi:hypothetical protein
MLGRRQLKMLLSKKINLTDTNGNAIIDGFFCFCHLSKAVAANNKSTD